MIGARRINERRRVGLPKSLAAWSGISPETWVAVGLADDRRWALDLRPVPIPGDSDAMPLRDPLRPRMVTTVMQVTLPKALMEEVGLKPADWVFLNSLGENRGMRVVPQSKVRLREVSAARPSLSSGKHLVRDRSSWSG